MDRDRARLFDHEAERYDRSRPGYPAELFDEVLGPSPHGLCVLDVACGTGIASREMTNRGAHVLGVDLNARMAEVAEQHGIPTEVAPFETWDPLGRTFDLVTCAQAWHWLDAKLSATKVASVLRPGGRVGLFWSIGHHPDDLAEALRATYLRALPPGAGSARCGYAANTASDPTPDFGEVTDALRESGGLVDTRVTSFPWTRAYTRDLWLDELLSHSDHIALAPEVRSTLLDEIGTTIDRFGGTFEMSYVTVLISATRA
ncbi:MAG TPA: methyltransferase domain-containing protein [Candidatus Dormibacteraeota bacterium]